MQIEQGVYRHYKRNEYEVIGVARHSETREEMVVYKALYDSPEFGNGALWVRPATMFAEEVETAEGKCPRFVKLPLE